MVQKNLQVDKSELKELAQQALTATTQQPKASSSRSKRSFRWILPAGIILLLLIIGLYSLFGWQKNDVSMLSTLNNKLTGKEPIFKMGLSTDEKMATLSLTDIKSNGAEATAFISIENQSAKPYNEGQEILKGAIVESIFTNNVVIHYNDSTITLYLKGKGFANSSPEGISGDRLTNPPNQQENDEPDKVMPPSEYFQRNVAVIPDPAGSGGFLVQQVEPMGPYALFGVLPGDIIFNLDGKPHYNAWENSYVFEVYRNGQRLLLHLNK